MDVRTRRTERGWAPGVILAVVLAAVLAAVVLSAADGPVGAHPAGCAAAVRDAPVETVDLPSGWGFVAMTLGADGWEGTAQWLGGDIRGARFTLACVDDAAGLLQRRADVRVAFHRQSLELASPIGDEAAAWRALAQGPPQLEWRRGDVFGTVAGEWNASLEELALIARAIDAALPTDP